MNTAKHIFFKNGDLTITSLRDWLKRLKVRNFDLKDEDYDGLS